MGSLSGFGVVRAVAPILMQAHVLWAKCSAIIALRVHAHTRYAPAQPHYYIQSPGVSLQVAALRVLQAGPGTLAPRLGQGVGLLYKG